MCLAVVILIFNRKYMGVFGVCINNSPLQWTPFNGCKFHAFFRDMDLTSRDHAVNSTGVWCVN